MNWTVGSRGDAWNEIARQNTDVLSAVRVEWITYYTRRLLGVLPHKESVVLGGIFARTLSYGKFAEGIAMRHFSDGLENPEDNPQDFWNHDLYVSELRFAGVSCSSNTVRSAIEGLVQKNLITRWEPDRTDRPPVFMPMREIALAVRIAAANGPVAAHFPAWVIGELANHNGCTVKVQATTARTSPDVPVVIWNIRLNQPVGDPYQATSSEVRRLTTTELKRNRRDLAA